MPRVKAGQVRADWPNLPRDVLANILAHTGESPFRAAGVCKGWSWVLGCAQHRATLCFSHTQPGNTCFLEDAARSFATFVCSRPAVTTCLTLSVAALPFADLRVAYASLGAAITHLARSVRCMEVDLSDLITGTPFTDMCDDLRSLKCRVNTPLDARHLPRLTSVDLVISGDGTQVRLPSTMRQCRLRVIGGPPVPTLLDDLSLMRNLDALELSTQGPCKLDLSRLPELLSTLTVSTLTTDTLPHVELEFGKASFRQLETLGLEACQFDGDDLAQFLQRCPSVSGLVYKYNVPTGDGCLDLRHLPLEAAAIVSTSLNPTSFKLPRTVRDLALGMSDLEVAVAQAPSMRRITNLTLHLDSLELHAVWPRAHRLPNVELVRVHGHLSTQAAFVLGQRCVNADISEVLPEVDFIDGVAFHTLPYGTAMM